jgi:chromosome segregation ATPase
MAAAVRPEPPTNDFRGKERNKANVKFLDDILRRKAPLAVVSTAAPVEADELTELQSEIEQHRAALAGLEEEARAADSKLGGVAHLATALKVRLSEGDTDATAALDTLEREELGIRRTHDGLMVRIQAMQREIAPLVTRASELAQARDAIRQDEVLKHLTARTETMTAEIISHWRAACATSYDLIEMLDGAMNGHVPLDEEHRRQARVLNVSVGRAMLQATLSHVNERFNFARPEVFHNLKIVPARRRGEEPAPAPAPAVGEPKTEEVAASGLIWSHPGESHPPTPRTLPRRAIAG